MLGIVHNVVCTPRWGARTASTMCTVPHAGTLLSLPSGGAREREIGTVLVPAVGDQGSTHG
jgi:hypothetical protein